MYGWMWSVMGGGHRSGNSGSDSWDVLCVADTSDG